MSACGLSIRVVEVGDLGDEAVARVGVGAGAEDGVREGVAAHVGREASCHGVLPQAVVLNLAVVLAATQHVHLVAERGDGRDQIGVGVDDGCVGLPLTLLSLPGQVGEDHEGGLLSSGERVEGIASKSNDFDDRWVFGWSFNLDVGPQLGDDAVVVVDRAEGLLDGHVRHQALSLLDLLVQVGLGHGLVGAARELGVVLLGATVDVLLLVRPIGLAFVLVACDSGELSTSRRVKQFPVRDDDRRVVVDELGHVVQQDGVVEVGASLQLRPHQVGSLVDDW